MSICRNTRRDTATMPGFSIILCLILFSSSGCMHHSAGLERLNELARGSATESNASAADAARASQVARRAVDNAEAAAVDARARLAAAESAGSRNTARRTARELKSIEKDIRKAKLAISQIDALEAIARKAAAQTMELARQTTTTTDKIGARAHVRVASTLASAARSAAHSATELSDELRVRWLAYPAGSSERQ